MTENRAHPERWSDEEPPTFCRDCGDPIWWSVEGWMHEDDPAEHHRADPVMV